MSSGYVYVLQNRNFGDYVVKIGHTTHEPDRRSRQIYSGSTGVPEPFDVIFACSVADCVAAETKAHSRLAAYRINKRREFFRISPKIARDIVFDSCGKVNSELFYLSAPVIVVDSGSEISEVAEEREDLQSYADRNVNVVQIPLGMIDESPIGTSALTVSQLDRLGILCAIFSEVFPDDSESWESSFSRDEDPEHEILIWENIAKAFLKIDQIKYLSHDAKKEAYSILLLRSTKSSKDVIKEGGFKHFTIQGVKDILAGYEIPPDPVKVVYVKGAKSKIIHATPMATAVRSIFLKK